MIKSLTTFHVVPEGDGFSVLWWGEDADGPPITRVAGFATHEAAQEFIMKVITAMAKIGMARKAH